MTDSQPTPTPAPTNAQKLEAIYAATRAAPLTADQHENIRRLAVELLQVLQPPAPLTPEQ